MSKDSRWTGIGLGRLVGEVLIIVTGVLIAFGAEGYRESRAEEVLSDSYVQGLIADLRADSIEFERYLHPGYLPFQAASVDSLLLILADPDPSAEPAKVLRHLRGTIILSLARKRRATYDDMVGSGRLALIADPEVRRELAGYYSGPVISDPAAYQAYLTTAFFPLSHALNRVLGVGRYAAIGACDASAGPGEYADCISSATQGDELDLLVNDPDFSALVADQVMQRFFALLGVQQSHAQVVRLLALLNQGAPTP